MLESSTRTFSKGSSDPDVVGLETDLLELPSHLRQESPDCASCLIKMFSSTLLRFAHSKWKKETDYFVLCNTTSGEPDVPSEGGRGREARHDYPSDRRTVRLGVSQGTGWKLSRRYSGER